MELCDERWTSNWARYVYDREFLLSLSIPIISLIGIDLDDHTVGISTTRGFIVENERKLIEVMESQSRVLMLREKLEQFEAATTNLSLDLRTIFHRKDQLLQQTKQVRAEQDDLNDILAGPPRRDPSEHEKQ